jgi:hypothetical protein
MTVGSLIVDSFSQRDASGFKFNIRCTRCGDRWLESYRRIRDGFMAQGCHNNLCRLNRLPESKVTAHEAWLNSPEPEPIPEPTPAPKPAQVVEKVSVDYLRYVAACHKTGQSDVRSWKEFDNFGTFLHTNVMRQVANIEEKDKS